jgi:hypothetical protein
MQIRKKEEEEDYHGKNILFPSDLHIHIISPLYHNDIVIMGQFQYLLFIFIVYF